MYGPSHDAQVFFFTLDPFAYANKHTHSKMMTLASLLGSPHAMESWWGLRMRLWWPLTASGTSPARCIRADLMDWKISTTPSVFSRSSWEWMHMKVPVRPTPSLSKGTGMYACMCFTSNSQILTSRNTLRDSSNSNQKVHKLANAAHYDVFTYHCPIKGALGFPGGQYCE